jgi:quercetin dioxygenase-like cupin family protein
MPVIKSPTAPRFELPELSVTGLAAPSRGAQETCVWQIELAPGTPGTPHSVDREEIFVVLDGRGRVDLGGSSHELAPGDTLIVPAGESFALANPGNEPMRAIAVLPVGGRARLPGGEAFVPPWAQ